MAKCKLTLHDKSEAIGEVIRCQHFYVSCGTCSPHSDLNPMSSTNFSLVWLCYTEINHSYWMLEAMWPVLTKTAKRSNEDRPLVPGWEGSGIKRNIFQFLDSGKSVENLFYIIDHRKDNFSKWTMDLTKYGFFYQNLNPGIAAKFWSSSLVKLAKKLAFIVGSVLRSLNVGIPMYTKLNQNTMVAHHGRVH